MKVKMLGNTPSLSYVSCRTSRVVLPIPGCVGVRRERDRPFSFYQQCACALGRIQSSRTVVFVDKIERNHYCFDILLIYYPLRT